VPPRGHDAGGEGQRQEQPGPRVLGVVVTQTGKDKREPGRDGLAARGALRGFTSVVFVLVSVLVGQIFVGVFGVGVVFVFGVAR